MSKINETLNIVKAGSRSNKYSVLYPVFGNELDIICNATSSPGREISTVEVYVKGRKIQYAGEMADDGTWTMTIYNTPDLLHRRFFLKMIGGIHNFNTPKYINDNGGLDNSDLQGNGISISGDSTSSSGISSILGNVSDSISKINTAYNDIRSTFNSVKKTANSIKQFVNGDFSGAESLLGSTGYGKPWYMQEIIINQLGANSEITATTTLHNCFVTSVGPVEYSDETSDITTTEITFAFSGVSYGNSSEINIIEKY